jgi:hypothetical protein
MVTEVGSFDRNRQTEPEGRLTGAQTEPTTPSSRQVTLSACVRCGKTTTAQPWCGGCSAVLAAGEIDLGSGYAPEIDRVCSSFLSLYADRQPKIIRRLFVAGAVIRYPRSGIVIGGVEAIETWYTAAFQLAPTLVLDHVYADNGSLWTLSRVSFGFTGANHRPTVAQVAKLTLRNARIARMDVYPLRDHSAPATQADQSARPVRPEPRRNQLRQLLFVVGVMASIGSVMAAFVPATDPSTGVNVTVGFGLFNAIALAGGVILMFLGATQWSTPRSQGAPAAEHGPLAGRQASREK